MGWSWRSGKSKEHLTLKAFKKKTYGDFQDGFGYGIPYPSGRRSENADPELNLAADSETLTSVFPRWEKTSQELGMHNSRSSRSSPWSRNHTWSQAHRT